MKSKISHYFASMALLSGFLLALTGIFYALSVNLTRRSDPGEIAITYGFIGFGLALILTGINLMVKNPKEYHLHIVGAGLVLNCIGIAAFLALYPQGYPVWVYPNVTYVAVAYTVGVCLLAGNAFANTVLTQIEERARQISEIESEKITSHSEDEIEREVQRTLENALTGKDGFSKFNLELKDAEYDFILGKGLQESERKITVQDDIPEVGNLKFASTGKIEALDDGLDSTSLLLARANSTPPRGKQTKGIFNTKLFRRH